MSPQLLWYIPNSIPLGNFLLLSPTKGAFTLSFKTQQTSSPIENPSAALLVPELLSFSVRVLEYGFMIESQNLAYLPFSAFGHSSAFQEDSKMYNAPTGLAFGFLGSGKNMPHRKAFLRSNPEGFVAFCNCSREILVGF